MMNGDERRSPGESMLSALLERIRGSASVDVVYGESRQVGARTIIPVAAVSYIFGAGGGTGPVPSTDGGPATAGGGGGGGAVRVQPIGVLEVTSERTRLIPLIEWTRIITMAIAVLGPWMILRAMRRRRP